MHLELFPTGEEQALCGQPAVGSSETSRVPGRPDITEQEITTAFGTYGLRLSFCA